MRIQNPRPDRATSPSTAPYIGMLYAKSRNALARIAAQLEGITRNHRLMRGGCKRDSARHSIDSSQWPSEASA